jgi:outer membrane protein TolC
MKRLITGCLCAYLATYGLYYPALAADTATGTELYLEQAVSLALENESVSRAYEYRAIGFEEESVAEGRLPDPKIKLGAMNFPTDTFDRDQEPMTQLQVGVIQYFPRGDSRSIKTRISSENADKARKLARNARLLAVKEVTKSWLELYYWLQAEKIVEQSRGWFSKLVGVTESRYRVGSSSQQDVVQSELELDRLADRLESIRMKQDLARAELARWVGHDASQRDLPNALPNMVVPNIDDTELYLDDHPLLQSRDAAISASTEKVELARQSYKPGMALDVTYGDRSGQNIDGSDRANFLSAMVMMDVPLFTNSKQDRELASLQQNLEAAREERETEIRKLSSELQRAKASLAILDRQIKLYRDRLIPQSRSHSSLSLKSYENNRVGFDAVVRARISELDTQIKGIRLEVERAQNIATLNYLAGDTE